MAQDGDDRQSLNWKKYLVIGILWAATILSPWFCKWYALLAPVITSEKHIGNLIEQFPFIRSIFLVIQCLLTIALSLGTDLLNRKYLVWWIFLIAYAGAQVWGIIVYYAGPYEAALLLYWISPFIHVGKALQLCLIFSQKPEAYRLESHLLLATCIFVYDLSEYCLFWAVAHRYRLAPVTPLKELVAIPWTATTLLVGILIALRALRKSTTKETNKASSAKQSIIEVLQSINTNMKTSDGIKFVLFLSFLNAALVSRVTHYAVFNIDSNDPNPVNMEFSIRHLYMLGQMAGLWVIELVLMVIRRPSPKLSDVLSLGLPLMLYLVVLVILYMRLLVLRPLQKENVELLNEKIANAVEYVGPIPNSISSVVEFYNAVDNLTLTVRSPEFTFSQYMEPFSRVAVPIKNNGTLPIEVLEAFYSPEGNELSKCFCIFAHYNQIHSYIIIRHQFDIDIIQVSTHRSVKPGPEPTLIIMNTFMTSSYKGKRVRVWEETLARDVIFFRTFAPFVRNTSIVTTVPVGGLKVVFERLSEDNEPSEDQPVGFLVTQKFAVYSILLSHNNGGIQVNYYEIMRIGVEIDRSDVMKIQNDTAVKGVFVVLGAAYSTTTVAYLHHFWMDSPLRMRVSLLAVFLVVDTIVSQLIGLFAWRLEPQSVLNLIILQAIVTALHIISASLFFFHFDFGKAPEPESNRHGILKTSRSSPDLQPSESKPSRRVLFPVSSGAAERGEL